MKMTKLTSLLLVSGMAFSVGSSVLVNTSSADAATVISESAYKKVMSFTKEDLNEATGVRLTATQTSINNVYKALKKKATWVALGYNSSDAQRIANRISQSNYQVIGILTDIANNENLQFKVVTINQPNYNTVNVGTTGEGAETAPEDDEEVLDPETEEESEDHSDNTSLSKLVEAIEIKLEYKKGDIEVDYKVKSDGRVKAEVKNDFTGAKVKDAAAQKLVEDLFVGLNAKTSSHEAIKRHVMNKLNASQSGLKKFDFKVKYADKSKVDFKIK